MSSRDLGVASASSGGLKPLHLFIDANVFLKSYDFATEDLDELLKLTDRIRDGHVVLHVTSQVRDEVKRNRERQIASSLLRVLKDRIPDQYPNYAKDEEDLFRAVRSAQKQLQEVRQKLIERIQARIRERNLRADKVLSELFSSASRSDRDSGILERARSRVSLGNPPGKRGSIGDAVIWETLLQHVPDGEDLILVSDDADFLSPFDRSKIREFLGDEWKERKSGDLFLFPSLLEYAKKHEKTIELRMETKRVRNQRRPVERLEDSDSSESTHNAIRALERCFPFTADNVLRLVEVLSDNSQVGWISEDPDVSSFYHRLYEEQSSAMPEGERKILYSTYPDLSPHTVDYDDVPF